MHISALVQRGFTLYEDEEATKSRQRSLWVQL